MYQVNSGQNKIFGGHLPDSGPYGNGGGGGGSGGGDGPRGPAGPQRYQYKYKAEAVREAYLSDKESGLASTLRNALKSLFSEPRLPDNPYYYLAATLAAHVDQSQLWTTPAADLLSAYDVEGGLEPLYGDLQLCKISNFSRCYGLPHVLRVVSREGASFLHEILVHDLPECLFRPSPVVSSITEGTEYTFQTLCSVQGPSALWNPQLLEFPEIEIRCDVVIRGGKLDEALKQFVGMVVVDVRELNQIPVYFVDGVAIRDGPATLPDPEKEPFRLWVPAEAVVDPSSEFEKTATRLVLGGKVLTLHAVLLVEGPSDPSDPESRKLRYEMSRKTYVLHYHSDLETRPSLTQPMSHFGCNPYDALYGGYFLDVSSARQYGALYLDTDREPYYRDNLSKQMTLLRASIDVDLQHGNSLAAWRQLLLLVLLHDPTTVKPGHLAPESFPSLEALALNGPKVLGTEVGWLLSTLPNLLRINNSAASVLEGIVRELEALAIAAARLPAKAAAVRAAAVAAGPAPTPRTGDSRRTVRTPDVSRAMSVWLTSFGLEGRLLGQLLGLRDRILAATGGGAGLFAGISLMIQRLVSELPPEVPPLAPAATAALAAAQPRATLLRHLLHAAALTVAHGFVTRCADVKWALYFLRIPVANSSDLAALHTLATAGGGGGGDRGRGDGGVPEADGGGGGGGGAPPLTSWVVDVGVVRGVQVRTGALAERVSTEGVMLQYAVDTKLDEVLANLWQAMTDPPLPVNPYPRLLHLLRSQAVKMELWNEEPEEAIGSYLVNELTLLRPPSYIYAAHLPPAAPSRHRGGGGSGQQQQPRQRGGAGGGAVAAVANAGTRGDDSDVDEDDQLVGYGCYAAVTCVDVRALDALRTSLGLVVADRHWQSGAYQGEVVPALVGDLAISNALRLDRDGLGASVSSGGMRGGGGGGGGGGYAAAAGGGGGGGGGGVASRRLIAPFEHPRLYGLEAEEHHLVGGPRRRDAAQAFAREVVSDLLQLHVSSAHIVFSVGVVGGSYFDATDLWSTAAVTTPTNPNMQPNVTDNGKTQTHAKHGISAGGGAAGGLSYIGLERLQGELVEAALRVPEGRLLASVALYVAPARENIYVALTRHLLFQYRKVRPPLVPNVSLTTVMPLPRRPTTAEQQAELWPSAVYQRIFMSEFNASKWYSWNSERGDPAQPYHYRAMVAAVQEAAPKLKASGRVLQLQRSLLQAAIALQDHSQVYELSRVFSSPAQELKCLQEVHQALLDLLSPQHESIRVKLDNERVRLLLMTYIQRVRSALTNPKYNYFSGLAAAVPSLLTELQEEVLSSFTLATSRLHDLMQQLAVWAQSCEISVAAAVHGGINPGDPAGGRLLRKGEGGDVVPQRPSRRSTTAWID